MVLDKFFLVDLESHIILLVFFLYKETFLQQRYKWSKEHEAATNQYTQRTVDIRYEALLAKESAKDCHVPSGDSFRAKDMPTCIIEGYRLQKHSK